MFLTCEECHKHPPKLKPKPKPKPTPKPKPKPKQKPNKQKQTRLIQQLHNYNFLIVEVIQPYEKYKNQGTSCDV